MKLKNKIVLITGASGGIGSAIVESFAKEGTKLVLQYNRNPNNLKKYFSKNNLLVKADLTKQEDINNLFRKIKERYGTLDVLINVAGIEETAKDPLETSKWEKLMKLNLYAPIECSRLAIPLMNKGGVVINISSIAGGSKVAFTSLAYAVSKAALIKFSEILAYMKSPKIRVVSVSPGYTLTPLWNVFSEEQKRKYVEDVPIKRFIKPSEVAEIVLSVAKNDAISGVDIAIDGGLGLRVIE